MTESLTAELARLNELNPPPSWGSLEDMAKARRYLDAIALANKLHEALNKALDERDHAEHELGRQLTLIDKLHAENQILQAENEHLRKEANEGRQAEKDADEECAQYKALLVHAKEALVEADACIQWLKRGVENLVAWGAANGGRPQNDDLSDVVETTATIRNTLTALHNAGIGGE